MDGCTSTGGFGDVRSFALWLLWMDAQGSAQVGSKYNGDLCYWILSLKTVYDHHVIFVLHHFSVQCLLVTCQQSLEVWWGGGGKTVVKTWSCPRSLQLCLIRRTYTVILPSALLPLSGWVWWLFLTVFLVALKSCRSQFSLQLSSVVLEHWLLLEIEDLSALLEEHYVLIHKIMEACDPPTCQWRKFLTALLTLV